MNRSELAALRWPPCVLTAALALSLLGGWDSGSERPPAAGRVELAHLVDQVRTRNGFTVDPRAWTAPTTGYVVNTGVGALVESAATFFAEADGSRAGCLIIKRFLHDNAARLQADPSLYVGAWYNRAREEVVLSTVQLIHGRDAAIRLGIQHRQKSVYDVSAGQEIPTGDTGRR